MKIVITSGYFNPIHRGHIELLAKSAALGDVLVVIVNNAEQAIRKKGRIIIPLLDRVAIVSALKHVHNVVVALDNDQTVRATLRFIHENVSQNLENGPHEFIFAKGGDRSAGEIAEADVCRELGMKIVDGLGEKIQSSTKLIENLTA